MKGEPREILQNWVDAFNRADANEIAEFYAEHAVNHQVANRPVVGKAAIKQMFSDEFAAADMVCIVENDLIVFQRGYWDKLSFLKAHNTECENISLKQQPLIMGKTKWTKN